MTTCRGGAGPLDNYSIAVLEYFSIREYLSVNKRPSSVLSLVARHSSVKNSKNSVTVDKLLSGSPCK